MSTSKYLRSPKQLCDIIKEFSPAVTSLDVLDDDGGSVNGNGGKNIVLLNADDGSTRGGVDGAARASGSGASELHSTKVRKRNKAVVILKVFDDPLSILLAKSIGRGEVLGDVLASGQVLNDSCTRGIGGSSNGGPDHITSADVDTREIVGVVGVPLVPSYSTNEG